MLNSEALGHFSEFFSARGPPTSFSVEGSLFYLAKCFELKEKAKNIRESNLEPRKTLPISSTRIVRTRKL